MKKQFCDICGKPAANINNLVAYQPYGTATAIFSDGSSSRSSVRVSVNFTFEGHPQGYGGPPDLCRKCVAKLIKQIQTKATGLPPANQNYYDELDKN